MSHRLVLAAALFMLSSVAFGQKKSNDLFLKTGKVSVLPNLSATLVDSFNKGAFKENKAFAIIQFESLPTEELRKDLATQGIELLDYIPDNAFTVSIKKSLNLEALKKVKAQTLLKPAPQQKMAPALAKGILPAWAVKIKGTVDLSISFPKTFSGTEILSFLKQLNVEVLSTELIAYHIISIRIASGRLLELADQPFIEYVQPVPPADQPLNYNSRKLSHANVLNASVANGGKGLNGEGVTIGVGDNADVQFHVDFSGRLIDRAATTQNAHGTHTTGTAAGAGIVNELFRGYAPKATIVSQTFGSIFTNAATYVQDYRMVVTNNSYGAIIDCDYNGTYDIYSRLLDQQAFDFPYLQHVFAAGNSGESTCNPYPQGFRTVLGAYQSAKNIISVGNVDADGNIFSGSSKGPVKDGRLKPEITAAGVGVISSVPTNGYGSNQGTSMAAPAVAGGLALLYQRYRQLHANADPKSGLMKALVCNGGTDRGNAGPDYSYGFGTLNLLRSIDMLEANRYFIGNATNNSTNTYSIPIPANTAQLKVMLYWHDPASSLLTGKMLVNDLDLEVTNSSATTYLPFILDSAAARVTNTATTGADHINNVEQVVVNNPTPGNYTIKIKGTAITQNPAQEYYVVYDVIPNSLQLTYPVGGEGMAPGETERINWEAYGDNTNSFTLQYSTDNGITWTDIATNVSANTRFFSWQVPTTVTDKALIKIIKNGTGQESISKPFTIIGVPIVSLSATQCEGYFSLNWTTVPNASDYEIMMLRGDEMTSVATTTAPSFTINSLSKDSTYWVGVRARVNGKWGRRSIAISRQPNNGNCNGAISDNDLKLNAVLSPVSGRKFTSTELSAATPVKVEIKNLDDAPATGFILKYSIDNGTNWVTENVSATIAAGEVYTYTFTTPAKLSAIGTYNVIAVVKNNASDAAAGNDTLRTVVKHIDNQPLNLSTAWMDNMETAAEATYQKNTVGLNGLERYDFTNTTPIGRLRTFVNSNMTYSGIRAITMDVDRWASGDNVNYFTGTFNLSAYNVNTNALRLDFQYAAHGPNQPENNKVWIRGNDTTSWIEVYNLIANQNFYGQYKLASGIAIGDSLLKYGQNFSSSFQIRWGQNGQYPAVELQNAGGFSFDDVRLLEAINDVQVLRIDTPANANSCGLNTSLPLKATIKNGSRANLTNIPIKYSINGDSWVSEVIPTLAAGATIQFSFSKELVFPKAGIYTIKVVADYPTDNYRQNDTATTTVQITSLIAAFPYLENFERGEGGWYATGTNSSWQYGTPASVKINGAASGAKAWKTRLAGHYNDREFSYLYSPCFNISGMSNPTLSFSMAIDVEDCGTTFCDAAWVEYSIDGKSWRRLVDTTNSSTNWYGATTKFYWSIENYTRWHVATVALPTDISQLRLRFVMYADPGVTREGLAIDDIHIYDNTKGIYDGETITAPITHTISGNNMVDFEKDGKLIASLLPNNQNLGATAVQVYINKGNVRHTENLYYHDRSITIKPQKNLLSDSVTIRFYYLDSEVESMLAATECPACKKPASAYDLEVAQYDDANDSLENGTIDDNKGGLWSFFSPDKAVKVPFDKGYYAEFKVKDFSEFWLNAGGLNQNITLPAKLMNFTVQRGSGEDVKVNWTVASEAKVNRYEIEVARGTEDLQSNRFEKIGVVKSQGTSASEHQYSFTDNEKFKTGIRYYRLKTVNEDETFTYSVIRSIQFMDNIVWQVFPNPSNGMFYFVYQLNENESLTISINDGLGRTIKTFTIKGNGLAQKQQIDMSGYGTGLYLLQVQSGQQKQTFKLLKK